jgi:hypothetical protein
MRENNFPIANTLPETGKDLPTTGIRIPPPAADFPS